MAGVSSDVEWTVIHLFTLWVHSRTGIYHGMGSKCSDDSTIKIFEMILEIIVLSKCLIFVGPRMPNSRVFTSLPNQVISREQHSFDPNHKIFGTKF